MISKKYSDKSMRFLSLTVFVFSSAVLLSSCSGVQSNLGETITDKSVLMTKLRQKSGSFDSSALNFASPALRKDRDVVLTAVWQDGDALQYAAPSLKKDKQIVLAAITNYGEALKFADASLRRDEKVVLAAVKEDGTALKYADAALR